jgi:hypothetical protein
MKPPFATRFIPPANRPDVALTVSWNTEPAGMALLAIAIVRPQARETLALIDGIVAFLEEALFLDAANDDTMAGRYRWSLRRCFAWQYATMFQSYFEFLDLRCAVVFPLPAPQAGTPH